MQTDVTAQLLVDNVAQSSRLQARCLPSPHVTEPLQTDFSLATLSPNLYFDLWRDVVRHLCRAVYALDMNVEPRAESSGYLINESTFNAIIYAENNRSRLQSFYRL
jgi:hypothetical protein